MCRSARNVVVHPDIDTYTELVTAGALVLTLAMLRRLINCRIITHC